MGFELRSGMGHRGVWDSWSGSRNRVARRLSFSDLGGRQSPPARAAWIETIAAIV